MISLSLGTRVPKEYLVNALKDLTFLKTSQISTDPEILKDYGKDWTRYYTPNPIAVLFPQTTKEVQEIIFWARKNKIALVPSGGRTGLSGGAVAQNGEVVISLSKMNQILKFDELNLSISCQAGVITEALQDFATQNGYHFPVDFAARGSSQIGGNIATNVGGLNVIHYGLMRDWVLSLTVVTGQGEILNLNNGLIKNNTGYDLRQLFIGSEGTLGIITEATLKITPPPQKASIVILGLQDYMHIQNIFVQFRRHLTLFAFEMFTDKALDYVLKSHTHLKPPFQKNYPYYILAEVETANEHEEQELLAVYEDCFQSGFILDGVISQSQQQAEDFWKYRDFISESLSPMTPYKNDISVKISDIPNFIREIDIVLKKEYPHYEVVWFGHIGDGNLHINILKPPSLRTQEFVISCQRVDEILFSTIQKFQGSISAEHGVGLSKKPFLHFTKSKQEIQIMKEIKKVFDPDNILNPGKIFD